MGGPTLKGQCFSPSEKRMGLKRKIKGFSSLFLISQRPWVLKGRRRKRLKRKRLENKEAISSLYSSHSFANRSFVASLGKVKSPVSRTGRPSRGYDDEE